MEIDGMLCPYCKKAYTAEEFKKHSENCTPARGCCPSCKVWMDSHLWPDHIKECKGTYQVATLSHKMRCSACNEFLETKLWVEHLKNCKGTNAPTDLEGTMNTLLKKDTPQQSKEDANLKEIRKLEKKVKKCELDPRIIDTSIPLETVLKDKETGEDDSSFENPDNEDAPGEASATANDSGESFVMVPHSPEKRLSGERELRDSVLKEFEILEKSDIEKIESGEKL